MAEYYVIRDKNTGLYFRGKGVNRWGKHYNQASIYRVKGSAEFSCKEINHGRNGEQAEIVPIQIIESAAEVAPRSEVAREIFGEIDKLHIHVSSPYDANRYAELKKKYTEEKQ